MTYRDPATPPEEPVVRDYAAVKWFAWFFAFGLTGAAFCVGSLPWLAVFRIALIGPAAGLLIAGVTALIDGRPPWRQR